MTRSITLLCAAVLLSVFTSAASAQGGARAGAQGAQGQAMEQRGQGQGRGIAQQLLRDITLTPTQQDTISKLAASLQSQQRAMMQQATPGQRDPAMMQKRRELMTSHQSAVRALLTTDQQGTFDRNVKAMQERVRGGGRDQAQGRQGRQRGTNRPA